MSATPPEFESVEDQLRKPAEDAAWRRSLEEQQSSDGKRRAAAQHAELRRFFVDGGYLKGVLVLVNVETGQAAAALEVEHGGEVHTLSRSETRLRKWGPYRRIRAQEAAKLLEAGRVELEDVPWHGFEICVRDGTYPEWLFTPTDEPAGAWKPAAMEFKRRAAGARAFAGVGSFAPKALYALVAVVAIYVVLRVVLGVDLLQAILPSR